MTIPKQFLFAWEKQTEPFGIKDKNSIFLYANKAYRDLLCLPNHYEVAGRKDEELPAPTAEFAEQFQKHDRLVESTEQIKRALEVHPFGRDQSLQAYYFEKTPFYNEQGNVVGTLFHGYKTQKLDINFTKVASQSMILSPPNTLFSYREWEIVFLLLNGQCQKSIAKILEISPAGVKQRISSIYNKAGINSVLELKKMGEEQGWGCYFPERLIPRGHFLL